MTGFTLSALAGRLREAGFLTENFEYSSMESGSDSAAERLRQRMQTHMGDVVHLLGHSLGGLVALHAVDTDDKLPDGRIVCIGSPLNGSAAARGLDSHMGMHWMLGQSREMLRSGFNEWTRPREVGVIAGTKSVGLGSVFGSLPTPNDGTVSVVETQLPGITDHCSLPVTHSGMVFSSDVAAQCVAFLRYGHFSASDQHQG